MKSFNGKAIYNPSGKAGEYSYWACNFYVGCSNGCTYCYCKKGIMAGVMGMNKPQLKKCFEHETDAFNRFVLELERNLLWEGKSSNLYSHGLFFSFTTDPMLPETIGLTQSAIRICLIKNVPVKVLTKCTEWVQPMLYELVENDTLWNLDWSYKNLFAIGFTLTGHDELEPGASTNAERIEAMRKLHDAGFKTFASIEPIIDFESSYRMITESSRFCDLYKIGLLAGSKHSPDKVKAFMFNLSPFMFEETRAKYYFKDSILKAAGINRSELPANCVDRDYNIFKD